MSKEITVSDIARELDTTASTVSRALNNNPRISDETRRLVSETAKRLGYRRNQMASSLRKGKSDIIGVIVPYVDRTFFSSIIGGIEEFVNGEGYNVMICQSNDQHEKEMKSMLALQEARVSAIALAVSGEVRDYDHIGSTIESGTPVILFDRVVESFDTHSILSDDYKGAYDATEHLVKMGYGRIALFIGNEKINIYRERLRGYKDALEQNGMPLESDYILDVDPYIEDGRQASASLMNLSNPPNAILSSSDYSALGAMQYLQDRGVKIPEEFGLVGFSNEPFTEFVTPSLSTIDQKSKLMGEVIGQTFMGMMNSKSKKNSPRKVFLKPQLVVRQSSLRIV